jgi:hypothetical protein
MLPRVFLFSVIIKSENTKNILTFCNYTKNLKILYSISLVLPSVIYFLLFYFISCTYFETFCLITTWWSWGHKRRNLFCRWRERRELSQLFSESSILTLSHPCEKNYSCYNTLHLESQQSGTLLSVISRVHRSDAGTRFRKKKLKSNNLAISLAKKKRKLAILWKATRA